MKYFIHFLFLLCIGCQCYCQNWQPVGLGTDNQVRTMFADSVSDKLYVGGDQIQSAGGIHANGIASWDGMNWDSLGSGIINDNVLSMLRIDSEIIMFGAFDGAGGLLSSYIAKWNGLVWDSFPVRPNATVYHAQIINNKLCIGGTFNRAGSVAAYGFASWSGANWDSYNLGTDSTFSDISCFQLYRNNLYVGGNFLFNSPPQNDLLRWDSLNSYTLGAGVFGNLSGIDALEIFNNELYIGGYFRRSDGNVGDYIMKWDGGQLSEVGGGTNDHVFCMKAHGQFLYVAGIFTVAGGIQASRIARWDGSNWSALGSEIFNNGIVAMDFFNDELYVGGGFSYIDTLSVNNIAKYTGLLAVKDFSRPSLGFYLTPNPSNSFITVSFSSPLMEEAVLKGTDAQGREQFRVLIPRQTMRKELDISELAAGVYFVTVENERGSAVQKLVVQ